MLKRLTSKRHLVDYVAYDLEWFPGTYELRIIGVYDGIEYRHYLTVEEFFDGELVPSNQGRWFYAHFGGGADMTFFVEKFISDPSISVTMLFSGSSAFIVKVKRHGMVFYFVDSYWLIPTKLRKIGEWIGYAKGSKDEMLSPDFDTMRAYNKRDCELLWEAIYTFQELLFSLGGELRKTIASSALTLFRRKYLKRDIRTSDSVNAIAKESYFSSRVEPFQLAVDNGYYYDINSSFPSCMRLPLPANLIGQSNHLSFSHLSIATVTVSVPDMFLPPLPVRRGGRVFFPVGKWGGTYTGEDLKLLLEVGGTIEKVHSVLYFEAFDDLADYANDIYALRKASNNPAERKMLKILLNSLYGKFGEGDIGESALIHPSKPVDDSYMVIPGVYRVETRKFVPHAHVPISSYITAYARSLLYRYMASASDVHYCDTDGFSTSDPDIPTSAELGALKLEKKIGHADFLMPKFYRIRGLDMDGNALELVKAKGFSGLSWEGFDKIKGRSAKVPVTRMSRVKELLQNAGKGETIHPYDKHFEKGLRNITPKRFEYSDGSTRPWTIGEIDERLG